MSCHLYLEAQSTANINPLLAIFEVGGANATNLECIIWQSCDITSIDPSLVPPSGPITVEQA